MAAIMKTATPSSAPAKPSGAAVHDPIRDLRSNITISGSPDQPAKPRPEGTTMTNHQRQPVGARACVHREPAVSRTSQSSHCGHDKVDETALAQASGA
jgi:hypothetical protein